MWVPIHVNSIIYQFHSSLTSSNSRQRPSGSRPSNAYAYVRGSSWRGTAQTVHKWRETHFMRIHLCVASVILRASYSNVLQILNTLSTFAGSSHARRWLHSVFVILCKHHQSWWKTWRRMSRLCSKTSLIRLLETIWIPSSGHTEQSLDRKTSWFVYFGRATNPSFILLLSACPGICQDIHISYCSLNG